ncbi:hypothetical protein TNIN_50081 [Trichonephila inaurata madagascariensis]|uniref:Transposase n=1 Tax=Trichonephila inaurata madagascariensis TaxID=2747483 RepID=A0A8X7CG75_9ARAC|nr:hypothetical protein TNIN_50081 [Trichonephila inaurata madagascariensis]
MNNRRILLKPYGTAVFQNLQEEVWLEGKIKNPYFNKKTHMYRRLRWWRENCGIRDTILLFHPYSPDLAPSDFYRFSNFKKFVSGKRFVSIEVERVNEY